MSSASRPLPLLRQQLRPLELSAKRTFTTVHTRSRCPQIKRSTQNTSQSFTTYSTPSEKIRASIFKARQQYPILLPVLFLTSIGSLSVLGLLAYDQFAKDHSTLADYPAAVEQQLRLALHFIHKQPNSDRAAECFGRALEAAEQCSMDPFSKEVLGIRVRLATAFAEFHMVKASIEVLDGIVKDCEENFTELSRSSIRKALKGEKEQQPQDQQTTMLRTIIEMKFMAAKLYMSEDMQDPASAKKTLSDAIGLLVQHTQDRQTKSFNENNAAGLTLDEIAAMLNDMADLYWVCHEHANAIQVFTLTLGVLRKACNGKPSCKEAQVLGGISGAMASAVLEPNAIINGQLATPETVRAAREAAMRWAELAISVAEKVPPEERVEHICEGAVLSSLMTKAGLLVELGRPSESKDIFMAMSQLKNLDPQVHMMVKAGIELAERGIGLGG